MGKLCVHLCVECVCVRKRMTCTYKYMILILGPRDALQARNVHTYTHTHACTHAHTHTQTFKHTSRHAHKHTLRMERTYFSRLHSISGTACTSLTLNSPYLPCTSLLSQYWVQLIYSADIIGVCVCVPVRVCVYIPTCT